MVSRAWIVSIAGLVAGGCDAEQEPLPDAVAAFDVGGPDTGMWDAHADTDVAPLDGVFFDASPPDASPPDASPPDASPPDVASPNEDGVSRLPLGPRAVGQRIEFDVPQGVTSFLIQARGRPTGIYAIVDVVGPNGPLTPMGPDRAGPNQTSAQPEIATALLPNTDDPAGRIEAGPHGFSLLAFGPEVPLDVEVWMRWRPGEALHVNLLLPPAAGRAVDEPAVEAVATEVSAQAAQRFALAQVTVDVALLDEAAPAELRIDGAHNDLGGMSTLGDAAPVDLAPGLDVYLVEQIHNGDRTQGGLSGGLPAPRGHRGTAAAVIAVRSSLIDDFPEAVADRIVHELGHGLGLYHTTEFDGLGHDPIRDTRECAIACDADGDGAVFATECGSRDRGDPPCRGAADNLMFWTLGGFRHTTPGQITVIGGHPVLGASGAE